MVPIAAIASEPRGVEAEHSADLPGAQGGDQPIEAGLLRDNLDENGASIWMRRGGRGERQLTMAAVLARL
jgi:hypothetical protein